MPGAKWELTGEAFAKLLAGLDPDPERAGARYESLRTTLVRFFDWQQALLPEDLADETLNRVARKLDEGNPPRDLPAYCHGVARLLLLESRRRAENRRADLDMAATIAAPPEVVEPAEETDRRDCFDHCLSQLPIESRRLALRYYGDDKRKKIDERQRLAGQLGIPLNALRSRVQRIRDRLQQCVRRCAAGERLRAGVK
ncbi:MAG: RNA polymerase sigma factor [Blastocatellia bacterium]